MVVDGADSSGIPAELQIIQGGVGIELYRLKGLEELDVRDFGPSSVAHAHFHFDGLVDSSGVLVPVLELVFGDVHIHLHIGGVEIRP